ncbi:MAG: hypothetical protein V3T05_07855, partial [Myxococcota bacterium]
MDTIKRLRCRSAIGPALLVAGITLAVASCNTDIAPLGLEVSGTVRIPADLNPLLPTEAEQGPTIPETE